MATGFPASKDNLSNPQATDVLVGHAEQHSNANDAIEALQTKVGIDNSSDPNSIDYKISELETLVESVGNSSDVITELLGLDGNNDLTIEGIENKTTIDSFSKTAFTTVKYDVQVSKNLDHYSSSYVVLNDGTNINVSESNIISNTNVNLFNVTFEEVSGIIRLCLTPTSGSIRVRYIRTALKA
jgi:hypothetical protein